MASMLMAATRNVVSAFDEDTYGCAGGGLGLCFGNGFKKKGHPTEALLSRGDEVLHQQGMSIGRKFWKRRTLFWLAGISPEMG